MRSPFALVAALALSSPAVAGPPESVDATLIPNYTLVRPGLAAAGQPTSLALAQIGTMGFSTVVNLRTEKETDLAAESAVVTGQGVRYLGVPVSPDTFRLEDALAVEGVLEDPASGPVLLHCASANRVGGVIAVLEARRGKPLDEAIAAGKAAGLKSPAMENAVRRVLGAPLLPLTPAPASAAAPAAAPAAGARLKP
jgi:uncharacterized protein (TIGR01244 family)